MHFIITILSVCVCLYTKNNNKFVYWRVLHTHRTMYYFCMFLMNEHLKVYIMFGGIVCQCVNNVFIVQDLVLFLEIRVKHMEISWMNSLLTFRFLFFLNAGLERVAEELMGRRKWKQYQDIIQRSNLNIDATNLTQKTTSPVGESK